MSLSYGPWSYTPARSDALDRTYQHLLGLCDTLETIADALPHATVPHLCLDAARQIEPLIAAVQRLEEDVLFPLLLASSHRRLHHAVARLRQEHLTDRSAASEVADALNNLISQRQALAPDAVGYLLRAFFQSIRRSLHAARDLMVILDATPIQEGYN